MKDLQKYVEALKIENSQLGGHNSSRSGGSLDSMASSGVRRVRFFFVLGCQKWLPVVHVLEGKDFSSPVN